MISATRYKWLVFIISVLLIANVVLLYAYVKADKKAQEPKKQERPQQPKLPYGRTGEMLQKEVGFTKEQLELYVKLKEEHWKTMFPLFEKMRSSKDSFYQLLRIPNVSDTALKGAAAVIGQNQQNIDLQTFKHFNDVKALCIPQQQEKFDAFIEDVIKKMTMTRGRPNTKPAEDSLKIQQKK